MYRPFRASLHRLPKPGGPSAAHAAALCPGLIGSLALFRANRSRFAYHPRRPCRRSHSFRAFGDCPISLLPSPVLQERRANDCSACGPSERLGNTAQQGCDRSLGRRSARRRSDCGNRSPDVSTTPWGSADRPLPRNDGRIACGLARQPPKASGGIAAKPPLARARLGNRSFHRGRRRSSSASATLAAAVADGSRPPSARYQSVRRR